MTETTVMAILLTTGLLAGAPAPSGDNVVPPPALVVARLVAVPGSPVLYGPSAPYTLLAYGGCHYSFYNGAWFFATGPGGPWRPIASTRVPKAVRDVPTHFYKIPPGQAPRKLGVQLFASPGQSEAQEVRSN
jgi:hypothetical protein